MNLLRLFHAKPRLHLAGRSPCQPAEVAWRRTDRLSPWARRLGCVLITAFLAAGNYAHAAQTVYDFESSRTPAGELFDQDNWQARFGGYGVTVVNGVGWNGSLRGLTGAPRDVVYSRANDTQFSFAVLGTETDARFEFDARVGSGTVLMGVGTNLDDSEPHTEYGFQFGFVGLHPFLWRAGFAGGSYGDDATSPLQSGDWVRIRLQVDFTARGGQGQAVFSFRNLTRGMADFVQVDFADDPDLGVLAMSSSARPKYWNTVFITAGPGTALDNLSLPLPAVPVITSPDRLLDATAFAPYAQSLTIVGEGWQPVLTLRVIRGALPAGLTLSGTSPYDALLSGLPTAWGDYEFTVEVVGGAGGRSQRTYRLHVAEPGPTCVPVPCGLLAWWSAEGNGQSRVSGFNAQLLNNAGFTADGKIGQAFVFNHERSPAPALAIAAAENNFADLLLPALSVEGWVRPKLAAGNIIASPWDRAAHRFALSTRLVWVPGQGTRLGLRFVVSGEPGDNLSTTATRTADTGPVLSVDQWAHVAAVFDADGQSQRIFINGAEVATQPPDNTPQRPVRGIYFRSAPLVIGNGFGGAIDELALFGQALSADQILELHAGGDRGKCEPPSPTVVRSEVQLDEDTPVSFRLETPLPGDQPLVPDAPESFTGDGPTFVYYPPRDAHGDIVHTFKSQGCAQGARVEATVTFHIRPVPDPLAAKPDSLTTPEDTRLEFSLQTDDPDRQRLTYCLTQLPQHGQLRQDGQPLADPCALRSAALAYEPSPNFNGTDELRFRATDGSRTSAEAIVRIEVTPIPDAPGHVTLQLVAREDECLLLPTSGADAQDGDSLTYRFGDGWNAFDTPHGRVSRMSQRPAGQGWYYCPSANFNGEDRFDFVVRDSEGLDGSGTAIITVQRANDAPILVSASRLWIAEDTSGPITFTAHDIEGGVITFLLKSAPSSGKFVPEIAVGSPLPNPVVYEPNPDFHGSDHFTFVAFDGQNESEPATADIEVYSILDEPVARAFEITVAEDSSANPLGIFRDLHAENGPDATAPLNFTQTRFTSDKGFAEVSSVNGLPDLVYTPHPNAFGDDHLFYGVRDANNQTAMAHVTIHIAGRDDPPEAPDEEQTRTQGSTLVFTRLAQDIDDQDITYRVSSGPRAGNTVTIAGGVITYTPDPTFVGDDQFSYTASDGITTKTGTIRVHILPLTGWVWQLETVKGFGGSVDDFFARITGLGFQGPGGEEAMVGWDVGSEVLTRGGQGYGVTHYSTGGGDRWLQHDYWTDLRFPGGGVTQDRETLFVGPVPQLLLTGTNLRGGLHTFVWMADLLTGRLVNTYDMTTPPQSSLTAVELFLGRYGRRLTHHTDGHGSVLRLDCTSGGGNLDTACVSGSFVYPGTLKLAGVGFDSDPSGGAHILYLGTAAPETHTLSYSRGAPDSGFGLSIDAQVNPGRTRNDVDLVLDGTGRRHAIVVGSSPNWSAGHLHYLTSLDGQAWQEESIELDQRIGCAFLAVDHQGRPGVAYVKNTDDRVWGKEWDEIWFAMRVNGQWLKQQVWNLRWHGDRSHPSQKLLEVAFDARGIPGVAFYTSDCGHRLVLARPTAPADAPVDLAVRATPMPPQVNAGESFQIQVDIETLSLRMATDTTVTVTVPDGLTFLGSEPPPDQQQGQVLTYEVGAVTSCTRRIEVTVQANASGSPTVTVQVASAETDSNPSNNETHCLIISEEPPRPVFEGALHPPAGLTGLNYSFQIGATSLNGPCAFQVVGGSLPTGLVLSSGGFLSGQPASTGTNRVSIRATDPAGRTATTELEFITDPFPGMVYTWTGAAGSAWSNPANWSPNGVPGPVDAAVLANGTALTLAGDIRVLELRMQNGVLGGTATIHGNLVWSGGEWVNANLTLAPTASLRLNGAADRRLVQSTLQNQGTVEWEGGTLTLNASSIDNRGRWDVRGDVTLNQQNACSFANSGLYRRNAGGGTHAVSLTSFTSTSHIECRAGTLLFPSGNVTSQGESNRIAAALGASVSFAGPNRFEGTDFAGPGPKVLQDGSFSWTGAMKLENVTFAGGTLAGAATLDGPLLWTGGEFVGLDLTVPVNQILRLAGGADRRLVNSVLRNFGSVIWEGGTLTLNASSVDNTGLWDVRSDVTLNQQNACSFANTGRYLRSAGGGTHTIALTTFHNANTVDVRSGALAFPAGNVTSQGDTNRFVVAAEARLDFAGPNRFELTAFEGPGPKVLAGGTFTCLDLRTLENVSFAGGVLTGRFTLNGPLLWTGGELVNLDLIVPSGRELRLAGGADRRLVNSTLRNQGAVVWEGGTLTLNASSVDNQGFWEVRGDLTLNQQNACSFINLGYYARTHGNGTHTVALANFQTGTAIHVLTGTMGFPIGNVLSRLAGNRFVVERGAQLEFAGLNYFEETSFEGEGAKILQNGTFTWLGAMHLENVTFAGAVLTGQAILDGPLHWTGGEFVNLDLVIPAAHTLHVAGGADRRLVNSTLHNQGSVIWEGGTLTLNASSVDNTGLWEVRGDVTLNQQNACSFVNTGRYLRSAGTGTHTIALSSFQNVTTVECSVGGIAFPAGNALSKGETNRFIVASDARLDFAGLNRFEATSFSGPGPKAMQNGTFTWLGAMHLENVTFAGAVLTGQAVLDGPLHWTGGEFVNLDLVIPAAHTLHVAGGADRRLVNSTLHNQGGVIWEGGTLTLNASSVDNTGLWEVRGDVTLNQQNACSFVNTGRYLRSAGTGSHTIALTQFTQRGILEASQGLIHFPVTPSLAQTGTLRLGLAGLAPGIGYAQLQFASPVVLAGRLEVNLLGGFRPARDGSFTVITYPSATGMLGGVGDPAAPAPRAFLPHYEPTALRLTAVQESPLTLGAYLGTGRSFDLSVQGSFGLSVDVQTSTDLVSWSSLTNLTLSGEPLPLRFPTADSEPHRFFRLRTVP